MKRSPTPSAKAALPKTEHLSEALANPIGKAALPKTEHLSEALANPIGEGGAPQNGTFE
jgi:hypothetical protein